MCNVTMKDRKPSSELRELLGYDSIRNSIRRGRLKWFGLVELCSDGSLLKKSRGIVVEGQKRKCRSQKTWYQVMDSDLSSLKIDRDLAQNRTEWKISINPFSASQLSTTNFSLYNTYKI